MSSVNGNLLFQMVMGSAWGPTKYGPAWTILLRRYYCIFKLILFQGCRNEEPIRIMLMLRNSAEQIAIYLEM